jgi:transcriptional regulator
MFQEERGLVQGTLELLILKSLSWGAMHGYSIANWIESVSEDVLRIEEGSLYPALHRLERKKWIEADWGVSENNRKAKFYRLTRAGRQRLREQSAGWDRLSDAMGKALHSREAPESLR